MSEARTYGGSCHCGDVSYRVELDLAKPVISCNCSICRRAGTLLAFVPAEAFHLEKGEEVLLDYTFNKQHIHHLFCRRCGVKSFARGARPDGSTMIAVNVRCLPEVDLDELTVAPFDGASI